VIGRTSGNAINGDILGIGTLGAGDVTAVGGFDIYGTTNRGLAALTIGANTTSELFDVNLVTGAATRLATVGGGELVRGLAFAAPPVATVIALTSDNHLVTFKPQTPGTFDTDVAVTGLQGAEAIVGIDIRPSNDAVYALTDAGRLYTLDVATGALTFSVTLIPNPLDATAPFTTLAGTRFGVDFSPLDSQLRVQSDTGQNLRVNVETGETITDGAPSPGTPQLVGTAFSNSYAGASTSTHYALDIASNTLVRQTSIAGTLATVGAGFNVGTTFQVEGAFDIAGGENGLPLAALMPVGATQSTLYRVTLGNGTLTSFGAIGTSTTVIRAMTVRLQ
jgi:outer membrane protein assembly factor BamB